MAIPYKVKVMSNGDNDVKVMVHPQPVVTDEKFIKVVAGRFQNALISPDVRNTFSGRAKLKKELLDILADFHNQKLIKPRDEKDEGNS